MNVGIQDEILRINSLGLLPLLLADKTTGKNILWGTDAYAELGESYQRNREILPELITGANSGVIKNRARKNLEQQTERTKSHAEVFTPLWVCAKMNDYADEAWFGKKELFFKDGEPTEKIIFPKKKRWQPYVNSRRLELTCGEAPYLVSRYDVATGEGIPLKKRIGVLDRKLRAVDENTATEEEWLQWTLRAFKATYGYEFQGDNLLIARVNLLMTFEEYLQKRWQRSPTLEEYKKVINIIVWNLWQMDGLTGKIPYSETEPVMGDLFAQQTMDDDAEASMPIQECKIKNWADARSVKFKELPIGGKHAMKFDFIIGNPPYQEETIGENVTFAPPIYYKFLDESYKLANKVELIHPARFLFNAGSTPKAWNKKMLSDKHLKVVWYERESVKVFPNTEIKGGIAVTYRDSTTEFGAIGIFTPFSELNSIVHKVQSQKNYRSFSEIVVSSYSYHFTDKLIKDFPEVVSAMSKGHSYDLKSSVFERIPQVFVDVKPDNDKEYLQILGRINNQRVFKYILADYIGDVINLRSYKLFMPGASGTGKYGETLSMPLICGPNVGATETFLSIGTFSSADMAEAARLYICTKFARALFGIKKVTQAITPEKWEFVPLQNFTSSSDIDWSKTVAEIDRQLYAKYKLSKEEIDFIETHVKEMA